MVNGFIVDVRPLRNIFVFVEEKMIQIPPVLSKKKYKQNLLVVKVKKVPTVCQ